MGLHAYTKPADFVYLTPHARQMMFSDAQLVGGNVRFYMSYYGGPIMDQFDRPDGGWLTAGFGNAFMDQNSTDSSATLQDDVGIHSSNWVIASKQLHASAGPTITAPHFYFTNADGTATVIAPSGGGTIGLAFRANGGSCDHLCIDNAVNKMRLIVNGTVVWTGTTVITPGDTHTIRGVVSGNAYTIYLDGNLEGNYTLTSGAQQANVANDRMGVLSSGDPTGKITYFRYAPHADPVPTTVTVRNFDGTVVYTTSLPTTSGDHSIIDIPSSSLTQRGGVGPYGWYRLYLTGTDHSDGQWGTAYGDTSFCRIPDSSLTPAATYTRWTGYYPENNDVYARRVLGVGPERMPAGQIYNRNAADGVTTAGSPTVTSATANFTSADLGHAISDGSLVGGASHVKIPANTYIGVINSSTSIGLSSSATANVPVNALASGTGVTISIGSDVIASTLSSPFGSLLYVQQQLAAESADGSGRPRLVLGTFTNFTQGLEQTLTALVNIFKPYIQVWEVMNEPDSSGVSSFTNWTRNAWIPARNAIKAADPNALVIGPCPTTIGQGNFQKMVDFVNALQGSGVNADGWSYHPYNNYQGELSMIRRNIGNVVALVKGK